MFTPSTESKVDVLLHTTPTHIPISSSRSIVQVARQLFPVLGPQVCAPDPTVSLCDVLHCIGVVSILLTQFLHQKVVAERYGEAGDSTFDSRILSGCDEGDTLAHLFR